MSNTYTCEQCGAEYTSPTAAWACEDADTATMPMD